MLRISALRRLNQEEFKANLNYTAKTCSIFHVYYSLSKGQENKSLPF